ncbi:MAG: hypothetical protein E7332_00250 [Clostridiales bacterium]|nr:hypothetical protein [Clostridiales bacterium]
MQTIRKLIKKQDKTLLLTLGVLFFMYILIHDLIGSDLFGKSWWDSYSLQAMAWRNGSMGLGQNYEHLELAYFNGDWYVSFPPFPSVVLFPLTFIFGSDMPSNFIVFALAMLSVVYLDKLMRHFDIAEVPAALFSAFAVVGSNVLWMSTNGGVWFMAQTMCFALCSMALYYAVLGKRILANTLIAFSVGCRPFSLLWYFFFILYYLIEDLQNEKPDCKKIVRLLLSQWKYFVIPAIVGLCYMGYNYARFGSPLEFGHNYLPEFQQDAQFSASYILGNLCNILLKPVLIDADLHLHYTNFNGFMMYIANPIYLIFMAYFFRDLKKLCPLRKAIAILLGVSLVLLCSHRTMGGWQFGTRYTTDFIPFVFFYLLLTKTKDGLPVLQKPAHWVWAVAACAVLFNLYGTFAMEFLESVT